jgi:hypothetical protein
MNSQAFSRYLTPIYVLVAGALGGGLVLGLFTWRYPEPGDPLGQAFVHQGTFWVWIFLLVFYSSMVMIFLLPSWGVLVWLFRKHTHTQRKDVVTGEAVRLFVMGIFITTILVLLLRVIDSTNIGINNFFPQGHSKRITFLVGYSFLAVLPAALSMLLIHSSIQEIFVKIKTTTQNESRSLALINELQTYRDTLQGLLTMVGAILSMIPITSAGLRANLIAANPQIEQIYPISYVIMYGLVFTLLLLLIYIPTHLTLSQAGRELRDSLCPLNSLSTLKDTLEKRKSLDELLQTNIGLTQNLKSGIVTLAPLVSSLVVSLLGIKI